MYEKSQKKQHFSYSSKKIKKIKIKKNKWKKNNFSEFVDNVRVVSYSDLCTRGLIKINYTTADHMETVTVICHLLTWVKPLLFRVDLYILNIRRLKKYNIRLYILDIPRISRSFIVVFLAISKNCQKV